MTIARDKTSGEVIGQVCEHGPAVPNAIPGRDLWLLTKSGYRCVLCVNVQLEELR